MIIDACGLSCPQPVLLTMKAVRNNEKYIEVLVDNNTSCGNVKRFGENSGYKVEIEKDAENLKLCLSK
jgi:tRNA 2-thiouridine synthesizing protein A